MAVIFFLFFVEQGREKQTSDNQPCGFRYILSAMIAPPDRVHAAGERCFPKLSHQVYMICNRKDAIRPYYCTGDCRVWKSAGTQIENYLLNKVNLFSFHSVKWLQTLLN